MKASEMNKGDMFLYKGNPLCGGKPEVYVKTHDGTTDVQGIEASVFIKNSALVRTLTSNYTPDFTDQWALGDQYFARKVEEGEFIPINDIREASGICPDFLMDGE